MGNKDEDTFTCSKYSFYDSDMCPLMTKYFFRTLRSYFQT